MSLKTRIETLATRIAAEFKALRASKLDASVYTAADVLTKIKTIDGPGSGLDADLLDGYLEASYVKRQINTVTNNLGDPSVEEMALCHGQFTNKMRFFPADLQEESTNGTNWVVSTRATNDQLKDLMLGEGQTGGITPIPAGQVGYYRLTWNARGYCSLQSFYCYGSANGNSVSVKIEKYNTADGWTDVVSGGIGGWPEHTYIPHTGVWFLEEAASLPHHGKVRVTFGITSPNAYGFNINAIEWFGGYPAGRRNIERYDRDRNVIFPSDIYAQDGAKVWHSGNDGSGSGLDADLLDGRHADTGASGSTIVERSPEGYVRGTYFNSNRGAENSAAEAYLYDTGDGYMRKKTLANVRAELGGSGKGLDSDTVDGIEASRIVYGANQSGSNGAAQVFNPYEITQRKSGFWEIVGADWTPDADWYWGITSAHTSNSSSYNYSAQQIFKINGTESYFRTIQSGTPTPWRRIWHNGNFDPSLKANLDSPAFTGTPTVPTPSTSDNSTTIANTAFVKAVVAALVASSPAALDTLNELAAALGNDPNFATTITNALAGKYSINGGTLQCSGHALGANSCDVEIYAGMGTELVELSLRFHQGGRYYKQIRVRSDGFRFTEGNDGAPVDIYAAAIYANGNRVWDAGNFDPASKLGVNAKAADSDMLDGKHASEFASSGHGHTLLDGLGSYVWNAATLPDNYGFGISSSFVRSAEGFPSYGTVVTVRSFNGGGGTLQLYTPYSPTYGGATLKVRFGNYDVNGGNSWTNWYSLWHDGNFDPASKLGVNAKAADSDLLDGKHASEFAAATYIANQNGHGFSVGDCIKMSGSTWVKVTANSIANAGVSALVFSVTDANNFKYITSGFLSGAYTAGADYYSSTTTAGGLMTLSTPEVWSAGQVRQFIGTGVAGGLMIDIDAGDEITTSAFNDIYVTGMSFNNANRVLTLTRSASMPDLTLAIPYPPEDMGYEFRDINKGVAQTYVLDMKASWAYTIVGIVLESDGTLNNVAVKIGTTAVTGLSALTVGAIAETNASGANAVVAGNVVTINTSTSYSGTPTWLRVKLKIQRT